MRKLRFKMKYSDWGCTASKHRSWFLRQLLLCVKSKRDYHFCFSPGTKSPQMYFTSHQSKRLSSCAGLPWSVSRWRDTVSHKGRRFCMKLLPLKGKVFGNSWAFVLVSCTLRKSTDLIRTSPLPQQKQTMDQFWQLNLQPRL